MSNPHLHKTLLQRLRWHRLTNQFSDGRTQLNWRNFHRNLFFSALPVILFGLFIFGHHLQALLSHLDASQVRDASSSFIASTQRQWAVLIANDHANVFSTFIIGLLYFMPVYVCSVLTCVFWERVFIRFFLYESDGSQVLTSLLFILLVPLTLPLGYYVLGISFGLVFGKLIFGGAGRYLVNPALLAALFLSYSYPESMDIGWSQFQSATTSSATLPALLDWSFLVSGGIEAVNSLNNDWLSVSLISQSGTNGLGSTSAIATVVGMAMLYFVYPNYWRVPASAILAVVLTSQLAALLSSSDLTFMPWYWHLMTGQFLFCLVFIAFDPAILPISKIGHALYGALFGFFTVLFRVANPSFPESTLAALLLTSLLVPLIDWSIIKMTIRRRKVHRRCHAE